MSLIDRPRPTTLAARTWRSYYEEIRLLELERDEASDIVENKKRALNSAYTKLSHAQSTLARIDGKIERYEEGVKQLEVQWDFEGYQR